MSDLCTIPDHVGVSDKSRGIFIVEEKNDQNKTQQ